MYILMYVQHQVTVMVPAQTRVDIKTARSKSPAAVAVVVAAALSSSATNAAKAAVDAEEATAALEAIVAEAAAAAQVAAEAAGRVKEARGHIFDSFLKTCHHQPSLCPRMTRRSVFVWVFRMFNRFSRNVKTWGFRASLGGVGRGRGGAKTQ